MDDKLTVEAELNDIEVDSHLTHDERLLLDRCEKEISAGLKVFYQVGVALMTIRDRRLYRASYRTFDQYLLERWHFRRAHGYRLIDAVEPYQVVTAHSEVAPTAERQLRPLQKLPREQWPEAWKEAESLAEQDHTKLAVSHVERAVKLLLPKTSSGPRRISLRLCYVCDYSFSDEHHMKPRSSGGKHFESISLCPNHHRYATLLQHMTR